MFEYRNLENVDTGTLYNAFMDAFTDYEANFNLSFNRFLKILIRNHFTPELSLGAFCRGELVGFVLNGIRRWNGLLTAYDCGTGVLPRYRRLKISTRMFAGLQELFKACRIEQYLLEVIKTNTPAVQLYRKLGFAATREFFCFKADRERLLLPRHSSFAVSNNIGSIPWDLVNGFWDCDPAWQNSREALTALPHDQAVAIAWKNDELIGYGIIDKISGSVNQLAVNKAHRRRGTASGLLNALVSATDAPQIFFINIDRRAKSACRFLESLGFINYVQQYEMTRRL